MEFVVTFGVVGFILRIGFTLSGLLFLWWRKEYRLDRMAIHLKTKQGKNVLLGKTHIALFVAVLLWFVMPEAAIALLSTGMFVLGLTYLMRIRRWFFPPISPKVLVLGSLSLIGIVLVVTLPVPLIIALASADLLLFPFSTLIVVAMNAPTRVYHWVVIRKAIYKLAHHEPMIVIGVTGSYGKTSVKEYLATVLNQKFITLKTEASKNSPIGIAETVLRSLTPEHEVFVVEMGAYKRGEIRQMCRMVSPEIGIITAINPQHQDLFGSIETTMKAKYELVQGLVGRSLVVANADDSNVVTMGEWATRDGHEVIWFSKKKHAKDIVSDVNGTRFDCVFGKETAHVQTLVVGEHQVSNILAAIVAARACGMTLNDAAEAASAILPASGVMEVRKGINGSVFIDDTFNNNPDAAKAAIAFLAKHKGKKILVFQPMIELGTYAEQSHEDVGFDAGKCADAIYLTNGNWFSSFERGVRRASKTVPLAVASAQSIANTIRSSIKKSDMVLFKGKDAKHTYDALFS